MKRQIALFTGLAGLLFFAIALYILRDVLPVLLITLMVVCGVYALAVAVISIYGRLGQAKVHNAQADLIKSQAALNQAQAALNQANAQATVMQSYQIAGNSQGLFVPVTAGQFHFQPLPGLSKAGAVITENSQPPKLAASPVTPITSEEAMSKVAYNSLSWCFGVDLSGQPVTRTIVDSLHVLNVGGSGSGKTTLDANLLLQLVKRNDPDLYQLHLADTKNFIGQAFKPFARSTARSGQEYYQLLKRMADLVKDRSDRGSFDAPIVVCVIEELLTAEYELEAVSKQALNEFRANMRYVAIYGRDYRVFLLNSTQVAYASSKDFAIVRAQSATRLAGYVPPQLAKTMGFLRDDLAKQAWKERTPGQFLLECEGNERLILAPRLQLKAGELHALLGVTPGRAGAAKSPGAAGQPVQTATGSTTYNATGIGFEDFPVPTTQSATQTVTAEYRELPASPIKKPKLIAAYNAFQAGANSVDKLAAALGCSTGSASNYLQALEDQGYIKRPSKQRGSF